MYMYMIYVPAYVYKYMRTYVHMNVFTGASRRSSELVQLFQEKLQSMYKAEKPGQPLLFSPCCGVQNQSMTELKFLMFLVLNCDLLWKSVLQCGRLDAGYVNSSSLWRFNLEGKPNRSAVWAFAWRRGWLAGADAKYFEHSIGTWSLLSKVSRWLPQHHWSSGRGLKLQGFKVWQKMWKFPCVAKIVLCRQFR